ncbi:MULTISPECIES: ammonium transporter [Methanosphaera]|uniref:Ammonium transporter n=2 Tax=Methanosphaera stadtmanae TaxID=2317 RepID=Q2NGJ2_METST|nr:MULTISPECIES: ammonium transporter [Methanosphaera]ABC57061.1 ammonium transporter [Methanosphaera stadtmanae DSM 3091]MEE0488972.1 ammonium transporter [Methanosphaera stadtmanae]RAP03246.1 ammonia channel protein [Methanosphaera stadtmanae]RAP47731.1 MAG: ammonia channel protein [Methanosphaera sp. DEW79]
MVAESLLNTGDTAWILMSTALVMIMTLPGLALFYGGMSKNKNVLNTMFLSLTGFAIASVIWIAYGYQFTFGSTIGGFIGAPTNFLLTGISLDMLHVDTTIPELLYVVFQATFAAITVALISGAVVGRMKAKAWMVFVALWLTLVYVPIAHWVWGGGWLFNLGALDFAGGAVVHLNSGIAALALITVLGPRKDRRLLPHHLGYAVIGAALLWFGWFGFNAGSALGANGLAANAFITTNTAAAMAMIAWILLDIWKTGKPTILGAITGAVAGLVAITPAAGFVDVPASLIIGFTTVFVSYFGISYLKPKLGYDDALDAFGVHGLSGTWGAILTGVFACPAINEAAGLLYGNPNQLVIQIISIVAVALYSFIVTYIIAQVLDKTMGIRVDEQTEIEGLDANEHEEVGYRI